VHLLRRRRSKLGEGLARGTQTASANLSDWTISYEKTGGTTVKTWTFPSNAAAYSASSSAGVTSFATNSILVGDTAATPTGGGTSSIPSPAIASVPAEETSPLDSDIQLNVSSTLNAATTYEDVDVTPDIGLMSPQTVSSITSSGATATVTLPNNAFLNDGMIS
jgi:hypothetical protein